jgi:hypothetical protein
MSAISTSEVQVAARLMLLIIENGEVKDGSEFITGEQIHTQMNRVT